MFCIRIPEQLIRAIYGFKPELHEMARDLWFRLAKAFGFAEDYIPTADLLTVESAWPGKSYTIKAWLPEATKTTKQKTTVFVKLKTLGSVDFTSEGSAIVCFTSEATKTRKPQSI